MQRLLLIATVLLFAVPALAQDDKVVYKKKTMIDLSGAVIEGELTRPEGSYIVNRKLSKFSTLIQARGDFNFELLGSANDL
jgi:hypothetical protein